MQKKLLFFSFVCIAIISFALRMYHITYPVADWHSWRQADTAAVMRNYLQFGIDPLRPRYDDLSNIQSGKDNPQGWRMVEFPLYQVIVAFAAQHIPLTYPVEVWLRVYSAIISTFTGLFLGILITRRINALSGLFTSFLYAVLPYSIYYGRAILPDVHAVFFAIGSVLLIDIAWDKKEIRNQLFIVTIAGISAALGLLIKPVAGFLLLPIFGISFFERKQIVIRFALLCWYSIITLIPLYMWRMWISQYPEGIAVYTWLFNAGNIRFKGAWFYWLFAERIAKLMLGYWGILFVGYAFISKRVKEEKGITWLFVLGSLLYMSILAAGNVQHDYYQIIILPTIVILVAEGVHWLWHLPIERIKKIGIGIVSFLFMMSFSWYTIRTFYWINHPEIVEVGRYANSILPKEAKVIAPYNGDTTFLYQIGRQGWPIGFDIEHKIKLGATHYVTISPTDADTETKELAETYTVIVRNEKFAIIDLTKKK